jgi:hypothetical protein
LIERYVGSGALDFGDPRLTSLDLRRQLLLGKVLRLSLPADCQRQLDTGIQ